MIIKLKDIVFWFYNKFWHWNFKLHNPNWREFDMYTNGQLDDIPFWNFYKDGG